MFEKRGANSRMSNDADETTILSLPLEVLGHCFAFVGPGQYRFLAGTCRAFRSAFDVENDDQNDEQDEQKDYKQTTWDAAASSIARAKLCLEDEKKLQKPLGGRPAIEMVALAVAKNGNEKLLEWIRNRDYGGDWDDVFGAAAAKGHVSILQWAQRNDFSLNHMNLLSSAAEYGQIEVLNHIWPSRVAGVAQRKILDSTVKGGHIPVLEWMAERHIIDLKDTYDQGVCVHLAAELGQLHVLDWLVENGVEMDIFFVANTGAYKGRIPVLEWARNRGIDWNANVCAWAARGGQLATLQWLREQDCPWDGGVIFLSNRNGHDDVVAWARGHGCPEP